MTENINLLHAIDEMEILSNKIIDDICTIAHRHDVNPDTILEMLANVLSTMSAISTLKYYKVGE